MDLISPITITNLDAAEIQLRRAILLFLEEQDFVSALTLAGAAEEILGMLLREKGQQSALDTLIETSCRLEKKFMGSSSLPKEVARLANVFRNRLKHYNSQEAITFSAGWYAAEMIDRAIQNYRSLTGQVTKEMTRFNLEVEIPKLC